jgi:hypothetical protein
MEERFSVRQSVLAGLADRIGHMTASANAVQQKMHLLRLAGTW